MNLCAHMAVSVCDCVCVQLWPCVLMHGHMYACTTMCVHSCTYMLMFVHLCSRVCPCMYNCVCLGTCIYVTASAHIGSWCSYVCEIMHLCVLMYMRDHLRVVMCVHESEGDVCVHKHIYVCVCSCVYMIIWWGVNTWNHVIDSWDFQLLQTGKSRPEGLVT